MNSQLSDTKASLNAQIAGLQSTVSSLQGTVASLQGSVAQAQQEQSVNTQQIAGIQNSLSDAQITLSQLSLEANSLGASDTSSQQRIAQELASLNTTMQTLSTEVNALTPQVPLSTLVIVNDSYNAKARTFNFVVQNTQSDTVYAQLSAQIGVGGCGDNGNHQAYYVSPIYTFTRPKTITVPFNTTLIPSTTTCGSNLILGQVSLDFVAGGSVMVSPTYTFYYSLVDCNTLHTC